MWPLWSQLPGMWMMLIQLSCMLLKSFSRSFLRLIQTTFLWWRQLCIWADSRRWIDAFPPNISKMLTFNHFICAVLIGLIESNFTEYNKFDFCCLGYFYVPVCSSGQHLWLFIRTLLGFPPTTCSNQFVFEQESRLMINIYWVQIDHTSTS